MAYEQKELSGSLFKNDRKEQDNHPDRTGSALIDGVEYWVSGWIKDSGKGPWLSLAFKRKDVKHAAPPARQSTNAPRSRDGGMRDMPDDIPF